MSIEIGKYNKLVVEKKLATGYILSMGNDKVFLHESQVVDNINIGDTLNVFVYTDSKKRLNCSMNNVFLKVGDIAFLEVVGILENTGVFLNIGTNKDLLFSIDELPIDKDKWPQVGDKLLVYLKVKNDKLLAKPVSRFQVNKLLNPRDELNEGEIVTAWNIHFGKEGNVLVTEKGHTIFVYYHLMRKALRLGEKVSARITHQKGDFHYAGSLIKNKENMLDKDAEFILSYLDTHGGFAPYNDKSNPSVIKEIFHMSKSAFKRAIGRLYKNNDIIIDEKGIYLKKG